MLKDTPAFGSFSVKDIAAAKQFYSKILGVEAAETPQGLELKLNGARIFIYPSATNNPADFTVLNFVVRDIEAAVADLTKKGVQMEQYSNEYIQTDAKGIAHNDSGMGPQAMAWFKDPSGNIIGILQEKS